MKAADVPEIISDFLPRPALAREGWPRTLGYLAVGSGLQVVGRLLGQASSRGWVGLGRLTTLIGLGSNGLGLFSAFGYRDPQRDPLANDPAYFYAPADGRILEISKEVDEPKFIGGPAYRITISSHLLDVHVQRAPVPGLVRYVFLDSVSASPVNYMGLVRLSNDSQGRVLLVQQINPASPFRLPALLADSAPGKFWAVAGDKVGLAQKIGLAGFGLPGLVSLYLPASLPIDVLCHKGQHVQAGMSVLGRIKLPLP